MKQYRNIKLVCTGFNDILNHPDFLARFGEEPGGHRDLANFNVACEKAINFFCTQGV